MGVFSNTAFRNAVNAEITNRTQDMRDKYLSRVLKLKSATIEQLRTNLAADVATKIKASPESASDVVDEALGLIIIAEDAFDAWTVNAQT